MLAISFPYSVLSDVSPDDVAGKQVRDTARFVSNNAQKLMKDMQYEEMRGKSYLKNKQHCEYGSK